MPLNKGSLLIVFTLYTTCIYVEYNLYSNEILIVYDVNTYGRQSKSGQKRVV
jgi:hypothetical protein